MLNNQGIREEFGLNTVFHKGKFLKTSVGNSAYESIFNSSKGSIFGGSLKVGYIPLGFQNRPDLIAHTFLGSVESWWIMCEINNIFDVFENLKSGERIYLPQR